MNTIIDNKNKGHEMIPSLYPEQNFFSGKERAMRNDLEYIVPTIYPTHSLQTKYSLSALLESPYPPFEHIPTLYPQTNYPGTATPSELGGQTYAYLNDDNKNVIGLVDSQGRLVQSYEYDAYGRCRNLGPQATGNPLRWSSEYYDETLGLVFYNYRCYNPLDGRWLSRDPLGEEEGINLYSFVGNNPVNVFDVLGGARNRSAAQIKADYSRELFQKYESINMNDYVRTDIKNKTYDTEQAAVQDASIMVIEVRNNLYDECMKIYNEVKNNGKDTKTSSNFPSPLNKMEVAARICCKENKYYIADPGTSFAMNSVSFQNVPACKNGDKVVHIVHSHPRGSKLSTQDTNISDSGYSTGNDKSRHTPPGTPITASSEFSEDVKQPKDSKKLPGNPLKKQNGPTPVPVKIHGIEATTYNPNNKATQTYRFVNGQWSAKR